MKSIFGFILFFCLSVFSFNSFSQAYEVEKVEPPYWWINMENKNLQLMMYGRDISDLHPVIENDDIKILKFFSMDNPNYLFVDLIISEEAKPGIIEIINKEDGQIISSYELKSRTERSEDVAPINPSDVMYLITPDRFANGDPANDTVDGMKEKANQEDMDGRHGGDLQGIIDNLVYFKDLGVTTLWLNPVLENDQEKYSYHGYGISDFYKVDPRFGSNSLYRELVTKSHGLGIKIVMDQVFNHCGAGHWWMDDLPSHDWLNQWEDFTRTSFTNIAASDPYVSKSDKELFVRGWFDTNLPDLNLENTQLATYLIQNSIWWIESAGLDGIRMDTYPYPDKNAMARWTREVEKEYPNFYIVAETWGTKASSMSYWNRKEPNKDGYDPNVKSVSDYPLYYAHLEAFGEEGDLYSIYETLAEDFVYGEPFNNKIFNGNHDVGRLFTLLDKDLDKLKLSMAFLLTTRGIPQLYYGDELAFEGDKPDGNLRKDFPGGWEDDNRNAFTEEGRTEKENEIFEYVKTILQWRKNASEIHKGELEHYQPIDNIYVYFRYTEEERTMIILNNSAVSYSDYSLARFRNSLEGFATGQDILTGEETASLETISLKPNSAVILKLIE